MMSFFFKTEKRECREKGYRLDASLNNLTFIFDSDLYSISNPDSVYVQGTFNNWDKGNENFWKLKKKKGHLWTLEIPVDKINVPGNSGFPEFKFYVICTVIKKYIINGKMLSKKKTEWVEPDSVCTMKGHFISGNNVILLDEKNSEIVEKNAVIADRIKKLSDFDLTKAEDRAMISNVRLVPGTKKLFRGYHPYKISRPDYETEKIRTELVKKSFEDNSICSVITLSGEEKPDEGIEEICKWHQDIIDGGNQLYVNTDYNIVYFHSDCDEFRKLIGTILVFIAEHPGPYYIHCRLGTDRTGTCSAVLAALCGACWKEICADYQKSNNTGIREFRDWRLLEYMFGRMLGKSVTDVKNLKKELSDYFVSSGTVSREVLDRAVNNLKN